MASPAGAAPEVAVPVTPIQLLRVLFAGVVGAMVTSEDQTTR